MRRSGSVWGWEAGQLTTSAKTAGEAFASPVFAAAGMARMLGKLGHAPGCTEGPEDEVVWSAAAQRCLPLRRQQAGRFDSGSDANTAGPISEKLNKASNRIADVRRTMSSLPPAKGQRENGIFSGFPRLPLPVRGDQQAPM
jgi:hypothetical protein